MGSWFILTMAVVSAMCGTSKAGCSPCPFEWMENQNYCYRYFPENLSYDDAQMFCMQFSHTGHVAELATITSLEELTFVMEYIDKIFASLSSDDFPRQIWLSNNTKSIPEVDPILHRTLGPIKSDVMSCDSIAVSGDWYQLAGDTSLIKMVPAPDVVGHACAVYAKTGSYVDLGDFKDTCISDPGLCGSMTWSMWLKIDTSSGFTSGRYYISSGGQTGQARGLAFLYQDNMFNCEIRTSTFVYHRAYDQAKIPQNKWFHLTLSFDIDAVAVDDAIQLFVDGVLIVSDTSTTSGATLSDGCTKLYMGMTNTCSKVFYSREYGGSAAYSHLTVFDALLTQEQIHNIYSCGTHEGDLRVRSLITKSDLEYECTASDSSGPIITWSLYHKHTGSWENLDASGDSYTIQSVNVSTCVVRSTLVMSSDQVSPMAIACTAHAGSNNASVLFYKGHGMLFGLSDQKQRPIGISLLAEGSLLHYPHRYGYQQDSSSTEGQPKYPFICKIPDKMH